MDQVVLHGQKGGAGKQHQPVEEKNNLLSKSYAKVLVAIGEGEFAGNPTAADIYLDGTPLLGAAGTENFGGVKWEYRTGRSDQSYITGMPDVSNEFAVNLALTDTTPYSRLITNSQLDAIRITLAWPAVYEQKDNGDIVGYNIEYAIDVATNGGAFVEQGKWDTNSGKTNVEYNRTHRITLPKPGTSWTYRVRRITPNKNNSKFGDTMTVKSYAEVIDVKLRYPNTALLYVEFDAETFGGSSIPKVSIKTKGRIIQVPANYDPATRLYSGIWNGTFKWAWTDNPAWIFYDLVVNERFGLGARITGDMVDKWTLYQVAQYCDVSVPNGQGGFEPRYRCNVYIQSRKEAWQVLRDIVAIFNGMLHWSGTQMVATADMPVAVNTVRNYNRSNVVDGKFNYGSTSEKTIATTALVSFDDPENHYETAVEAVNDLTLVQRYKTWNQAEISAIGVTSRGQAQRKGKYQMLTNSLNRVVTFKLGMEGYLPRPGEVFGVADQLLAGSIFSGRVSAATLKTVTCDRVPNAVAGDILYVNKADGSTAEGRTIQSVSGSTITVTANYSTIPEAELGWYVEKTNLKSQLYRTTKVTWSESDATFEVTGVQYEDSKYAAVDSGARLESRPITSIPAGNQDAPTGLVVSSFSYIEQTLSVNTLSVKWNAATGAMNYEAQWRKDGGDWINVGLTASTGFEVRGIYTGGYQARVRAINAIGTKSVWTESANTQINGKAGAPPALAGFTTVSEIWGIRLNWAFQNGAEDGAYIQLQQATDINGANATELSMVAYPTKTYVKSNMLGGVSGYFRGRLIDRSGNQSAWTSWTYGVSEFGTDKILESIVGEIGRTELGQELLSEIDTTKADVSQAKDSIVNITNDLVSINQEIDANKSELQTQLNNASTQLSQQITSVNQSVNSLNQEVTGVKQDVTDLENSVAASVSDLTTKVNAVDTKAAGLRTDLDAAVKAAEYDATKTYAVGDIARKGQRLYQALVAVPVNKTPPNATYWKDVGTTLQEAGATAAQVATNTTTITNQGNTLTSHTSQLTGLTTRITNAETNITGNATALSNLTSTVTQQGNTLTSQGQSITNVQATVDGIAGSGTNLLEDTYSWLTSTTLPTTTKTAALTLAGIAVAEADSKFGYQVGNSTTSSQFIMLSATNNAAGYNVRLEPGTYLVSFYIKGSAAGQVQVSLYDGTHRYGTQTAYTTARTRLTIPVAVSDTARAAVTIYPNRTNLAALEVVIDSVMVEKRVGATNVASPFVPGTSAISVTNAASATTALTARVSTAEGTITSQGNSLTSLTNRVTNAEGTITSQGTAISGLNSTVTSQGGTITSQGNAITSLNSTVGGIGGTGSNLLPAEYCTFGSTAPTTVNGAGIAVSVEADAATFGGYALKFYKTSGTGTVYMSPDSTYAGSNISLKPKKYIVSLYARASTSGHQLKFGFRGIKADGTVTAFHYSGNVTVTDTWARYSAVIDMTASLADNVTFCVDPKSGTGLYNVNVWVDRMMVEEQIATGTEPSAFVIGNSAGQVAAQGTAIQSLTNRVTSAEGTITSQGSSITSLNNSLTTTNTNVTAAQTAANAANTLAGGKGKVLVQTATPAAADQLAQNLWIDITGGANTPKRWTGSAWQAVTDKVATDAATAAANALTVANTKADASALASLTSRVTSAEGTVTSQGQSITSLNNTLGSALDNSPTKVYQSVFGAMATDSWVSVASTGSATATYGTQDGSTNAGVLVFNGGASNGHWWGESTRRIRFDPTRLYKLTARVQQVSVSLASPVTYLGFNCFAEDGVTRINGTGANNASSSHYVLMNGVINPTGQWVEVTSYVKGHTTSTENGGAGAGTTADPKRLKAGTAWFSPMVIANYNSKGGVSVLDYYTVEDVTEQVQIDANASATTALTSRVTAAEGTITSQGSAITSLTNTVANKADSSAVTGLTNRVTAVEGTVTSQGQSITSLTSSVNSIGGNGTNLMPSEYSVFSAIPPTIGAINTGLTFTTVVDAACQTGYALKFTSSLATNSLACYLHASNATADGWNLSYDNSKYIISFYAKSNVAGRQIRAYLRALNSADTAVNTASALITLTTSWARYSAVMDLTNVSTFSGNRMAFALMPNNSGVSGTEVYFDRFMVEKQVGASSEPSTFNAGSSYTQANAQGSAVQALTNRVSTAEGTITSQGSSITSLTNRVTTAEGTISSQGSAIGSLTSTVTTQGNTITSQGNSLTALTASLSQAPDNLILKGIFEDGDIGPWTNGPTVVGVSAHAAYGKAIQFYANSFCGTTRNIVTAPGEQFDCSADIWNNYMTAGQTTRLQIQFYDKADASIGYYTAFTCNAGTNGFQTYSGRITAPAGSVSARLVIRHETTTATGRSLWCNIICRRVTAADSANADALSSLTTTVTNQGNTITSQGNSITSLTNTVNGKADATAVTNLTNRVTAAEGSLTTQSGQITQLDNALGDAGAENLLYNPTFTRTSAANANWPEGWSLEGAASNVPSLVTSWMNSGERAQRAAITGVTSTTPYLSVLNTSAYRVKVAGNQTYTSSVYVRRMAESGLLNMRLFIQFMNAAGTVLTSPSSVSAAIGTDGSRFTLTATAPADAVQANAYYRVYAPTATATNGTVEWARPQFESGSKASGWHDNGQGLASDISATSSALSSLTSTVTQQGTTVTSQGQSITSLTNSFNGINAAVNLMPAEFSVFGATAPTQHRQTSVTITTEANTSAYGNYALRVASTVSQTNWFYLTATSTDCPLKLKPNKNYIISFWVQADAARTMTVRLRYKNAAGAFVEVSVGTVAVTTTWSRVSTVITTPAAVAGDAQILFYQNVPSAASSHIYDGFMLEEQIGTGTEPSTFSVGNSARQVETQANALTSLTNRVTSAEGSLTSQSTSITSLQASVGTMAPDNLVNDPTFSAGHGTNQAVTVVDRTDSAVPTGAPSARVIKWSPATTASNLYMAFTVTANVKSPESSLVYNMAVTGGDVYDFELYAYTSVSRQIGLWIQMYDAAGTSISHDWAAVSGDGIRLTNVAGTWTKLTGSRAIPAGVVRMAMCFRVTAGNLSDVFVSSPVINKRSSQDNAQASALSSLDTRVTSAEGTITSQGSSVTQLQNQVTAIGGAGSNLLSDEYSWITSTTLPTTNGSATTTVGVAVAGSASGFGYKMTSTSTSTGCYLMLCPTNNVAGFNMPIEAGTYIVSFYASTPTSASVRMRLYSTTASNYSVAQAVTSTRTRYTHTITMTTPSTMAILFYYNMSGVSGQEVTVDSVMVEKQVGPTATASPFVAGPSARSVTTQGNAITSQGTALTALTNRVTAAEGSLSSASSNITDLQNSIGTAGAFDTAPGNSWNFDGTAEGWVAGGGNLTVGNGFITITSTGIDPTLSSPTAYTAFNGGLYNRVRAKITRRAGATTDWDGKIFYSTAAHGFSSSYWAMAANPNLAVGQSAVVEWDMTNLSAGGTDWTANTIRQIRVDLGLTSGGSFEVDWIAVGRTAPSASSGALDSLSSTVSQQGSTLSAQATSISNLNTTVGSQSTSISTISSTQNTTNGKLNALYSVKLGINSNGQYYGAGMGIGIENTPSGMQSQVLFVADRFAILNSVNGTATSPFVVQGGQVFINQAFINQATVNNMLVNAYVESARRTNWGPACMTQNFNNGNLQICHPTRPGTYVDYNENGVAVVVDNVLRVRLGVW